MAEKIVSPGVFTSEIDASFLPAAVADIGAAVIGPTVKGPAGVPTVVESIGEFEAKFGTTFKSGSSYYQYLTSHTVREYLKNSNTVTVVRILAGDFSHASSSIASEGTTVGATTSAGSITLGAVGQVSESIHQLTINGIDFVGVTSASLFDNSSAERYFSVGSTIDEFGTNLATSITAASSLTNVTAAYVASSNHLKLSGSAAGTQGNVLVASSSVTTVPPAQKVFQLGVNPIGDNYTATSTGFTMTGGANSTNSGISFTLRTLADGLDQNSRTAPNFAGADGSTQGKEGVNNTLPTGSKDNLRWEVTSKNNKKGTFNLSIRRGDDTIKRKTILESFSNLSLDPNSSNYIAKVIGDSSLTVKTDENGNPYLQSSGSFPNKSKFVRVDVNLKTPDYLDSNGNLSNNAQSASLPKVASGSFQGGTDGNVQHPRKFYDKIEATNSQGFNLSNAGGANGYNAYIEALNLLKNQDEYDINMILMPGVIDNLHSGIVQKAMDVAEERSDAFLVVDPVEYAKNVADATTRAEAHDNNYSAMYWPWIQIPDNTLGQNVWVPPSTVMGGIIAFNDKVAHPWFAPAGLNRGGIDTAVQAERKLTQADRDTLYDSSVNPIATFPGQGVVVFGQKTLQKKSSALDRVNVRRLLIRVKKFIASSSRFLVFEQNTAATRRRFLNIVNPFLEQVQANSGLSAFRVVMDETNNTPDEIDRNILFGQIFVQPTRTAEFIVLDFTIQPTGATFPE